jgi:hypothetical protein
MGHQRWLTASALQPATWNLAETLLAPNQPKEARAAMEILLPPPFLPSAHVSSRSPVLTAAAGLQFQFYATRLITNKVGGAVESGRHHREPSGEPQIPRASAFR